MLLLLIEDNSRIVIDRENIKNATKEKDKVFLYEVKFLLQLIEKRNKYQQELVNQDRKLLDNFQNENPFVEIFSKSTF